MPNDLNVAKLLDGVTDGSNFQTEILVITLDDNLSHPYFESLELNKDNVNPIGNAVLTTFYTDNILNYWAKYSGVVIVSVRMLDSNKDNTNSLNYFDNKIKPEFMRYQEIVKKRNARKGVEEQNEKDKKEKTVKQVLQNDYYNYSFIGRVSRFKQKGKKYVLYLEDLGWKFMQKVPKEFRDAYIAGQYLDDAFQAICEFMGVEFAYSIEDLHEYTFGSDGYSIQKDGKTIEDVPQILREWANGTTDEDEDEDTLGEKLFGSMDENTGLIEFNKKNNIVHNTSSDSQKSALEKMNDELNGENDEDEDKQSVEDKIKEYQEEFDEKVKNLFIGNTFYESDLCNPILNYDNITIEPKANTDTSNMSATSNNANTNTSQSVENYVEDLSEKTRKLPIGLDVRFI